MRIFLCNLRLPCFGSDVLVTLNAPLRVDPRSSSAEASGGAPGRGDTVASAQQQGDDLDVFKHVLRTLVIADPRLFGEAGM